MPEMSSPNQRAPASPAGPRGAPLDPVQGRGCSSVGKAHASSSSSRAVHIGARYCLELRPADTCDSKRFVNADQASSSSSSSSSGAVLVGACAREATNQHT
eukprot:1154125-Pelagomonas_calceolata.AAC.3